MQTKARIRLVVLLLVVALFVYPSMLVLRYIDLSGGSFSMTGARTALIEATKRSDLTMMRTLLILGVDPNRRPGDLEMPPLSIAAREGLDRSAEVLLSHGAHPDSADRIFVDPAEVANIPPGTIWIFDRPMFKAAVAGHRNVVDVLRAHGARYEIWDAIFLSDEDAVQKMISGSPEVAESLMKHGHHALAIAVSSDSVDAARALLDLGVDPFEKRGSSQSPYDLAVAGEHTDMIALLETYRTEAAI